jgi:hypothetical protein
MLDIVVNDTKYQTYNVSNFKVHDPIMLKVIVNMVGADKIILGVSDFR